MTQPTPLSILHGPRLPELLGGRGLADLFEATAARRPDALALDGAAARLRYGELDALADAVAHRLIADHGVRPGAIVGLWMARGLDVLAMQLAIAKTGAAWLPLDSQAPLERVAACIEDAGAVALVADAPRGEAFAAAHGALAPWLDAEALRRPLAAGTPLRRREGTQPDDPAYVIYTSGSTGRPKGIAISQGSICHFLRSENHRLGVREDDRVYQGFSLSFDMSFEEIWISWLVGATLWLGPPEAAGDPELLPRLLAAHGVTVLHAVPTLLSLFAEDVPGLRLINLGGEQCPPALVDRWARPGRQVFNTYGPTEATVSASLAELRPGEDLTIGRPLPNYTLLVIQPLADEVTNSADAPLALQAPGEVGELCIAGPGVALGYLGRPELTAAKFRLNPWAVDASDRRLYRTGDLARIDADGQVHCLGRVDDQVKVRGFRVELGEIETALTDQPGVGAAAVLLRPVDGVDQLVAWLVAASGDTVPGIGALREALSARLPAYMVPSHFEVLDAMPRIPAGKIDRKALAARALSAPVAVEADTPASAAESVLFPALGQLFPGQPIRRGLDFFSDLGGHSLLAARLVSALRRDPRFERAAVRDLYRLRRVGAWAEALQAQHEADLAAADAPAPPPRPFVLHSAFRRWRCGAAQGVATVGLVLLKMAQWLAPFFTYHFLTGEPEDSIAFAAAMATLTFVIATVLEFVVVWAGKWLVVGRLAPGSHPLWGVAYFRWWLADRLVGAAPTYLISGSSLHVAWLRALGSRIGRDVNVGSVTVRAPDLLRIGDGASIGNAVNFENAGVRGGVLRIGSIDVGAESVISSFCVLEGDVVLGEASRLEGQSALQRGTRLPPGRRWTGSPAQDVGPHDLSVRPPRPAVTRTRRVFEAAFFSVGALAVAVAFFMPLFPTFMLIDWLDVPEISVRPLVESQSITEVEAFFLRLAKFFVLGLPASVVLVLMTVLLSAAIRWIFLPRMQPGSFPLHGNRYLAKWLVSQIQESSLAVLQGIYATVYSAAWYRLLGARVGRDAELSTALGVVPDMLTLGDETFVADAVMLGDEEIAGGWVTVQPTVVSNRSFIGNGAYVPDGTVVPENVLIGVLSAVPPNAAMAPGQTWLGTPPINLPAREVTVGAPEALTYRPSTRRRVARGTVEALRIAAPHALVTAAGYAIVLDAMPLAEAGRWAAVVGELAAAGTLFGAVTFGVVCLLKWTLIGRYRTRQAPMWTPFVWLSEAVTNLYEGIAAPNLLQYLRGTPMLPLALNLMGARIASSAWLDSTDMTEFDCVRIGRHSEIGALSCPQTHLFEDRVMKIDQVLIGDRVTLGPRCTVLYGATVGDDVDLGPLTLVMKGEALPARSRWQGVPAGRQ